MADDFVDNLVKAAGKLGFKVSDPGFLTVDSNNSKDWIRSIDDDIKKNGAPEIIVTMTFSKDNIYKDLKKHFNSTLGIPS